MTLYPRKNLEKRIIPTWELLPNYAQLEARRYAKELEARIYGNMYTYAWGHKIAINPKAPDKKLPEKRVYSLAMQREAVQRYRNKLKRQSANRKPLPFRAAPQIGQGT